MMRRVGGGRERGRGEHPARVEEKGGGGGGGVGHHYGRPEAPPSRHLWVGNLPPHATQSMLLEQFLRFGDLENIAFLPGRSYAFVNFTKEEDAIYALRTLQGHTFAGMPLKIEFQKGDKFSAPSLDGEYSRNERNSMDQGESFQYRDPRQQHQSPERTFIERTKGSHNEEPSEVLWIGFPAHLNVDQKLLERAFSPFGEIEKITTFPGRSYAFVRYRRVVAACLAKEALQGRLFDNPRVSICFAKSDIGPHEHGKGLPIPKLDVHGLNRPIETPRRDRNFEASVGEFRSLSSRSFLDDEEIPGDIDAVRFGRETSGLSMGPGPTVGTFEHPRYQGLRMERRIIDDRFERHISPPVDRDSYQCDFLVERPRWGPLEDSWDMDHDAFPLAKKIRTDVFPDKDLPEYPFSDFEKGRQHMGPPKLFPCLPERQTYNEVLESDYGKKKVSERSSSLSYLSAEINDSWRNSEANFGASSTLLHAEAKPEKWFKSTPEHPQFPLNEWKWEGTIAKGGTPICRARCFPVGKVLDFMLPQFLDCTARTGLDMLARHFYQASSSWVVFFVPENDADIVFYNEFMHYLGEKHRAAVAKLGEKTTLFLVPPSEFSEKVLKVPGKVSISGVILRFQQPSSNFGSGQYPTEKMDSNILLAHRPASATNLNDNKFQPKPVSPDFKSSYKGLNYFSSLSDNFTPTTSFSASPKPSTSLSYPASLPALEKIPDTYGDERYNMVQKQNSRELPSQSPTHNRAPNSGYGILPSTSSGVATMASHSTSNHVEEHTSLLTPGRDGSKFPPSPVTKPPLPSTESLPPLQPEHLVQLAAFLGQQKLLGRDPSSGSFGDQKQTTAVQIPSMHDNSSASSNSIAPHLSQMQQLLQHTPSLPAVPETVDQQSDQQKQNGGREESEADPQKRLQATLQLAAALLQQIQQQSKSDN